MTQHGGSPAWPLRRSVMMLDIGRWTRQLHEPSLRVCVGTKVTERRDIERWLLDCAGDG
jgi:hypothetical protein